MHLHRNELKDRALSLWTKYTVAGTSFTSVSPCSLLSASDRSNSWLLRVHHALPALVRRRRPRHRLFPRVSRAGPEALDRRRVLLYAPARPGVLSQSGPSLEVVRPPFPFRMRADAHGAHSYKRTYMPSSYHIAQEIQKYNIPDYRPRQEQCVPSLARACRLLTPPRTGSKRRSRRCAPSSACGAIAGLRSARRRTRGARTSHASFARTTRQSRTRARRGIDSGGSFYTLWTVHGQMYSSCSNDTHAILPLCVRWRRTW